jgi:hypothetical protein
MFTGPTVVYHSCRETDTITFTGLGSEEWPAIFKQHTPSLPGAKRICAFTDQPATYLDPSTGLGFSSVESFQTLRQLQRQMLKPSLVAPVGGSVYQPPPVSLPTPGMPVAYQRPPAPLNTNYGAPPSGPPVQASIYQPRPPFPSYPPQSNAPYNPNQPMFNAPYNPNLPTDANANAYLQQQIQMMQQQPPR